MYTAYDHLLQEVLIDESTLKARIAALGSDFATVSRRLRKRLEILRTRTESTVL